MQDIRIIQLQAVVDAMQNKINDISSEIGRMKDRMMDTAATGDIHRLNPTSPMKN
jgi:hypothetical protein